MLLNYEASTVAEILVEHFFSRFGVPVELHSDQGREFESRVFQECCKLLGVRKTRTTPLRPQSDGLVERLNQTLVQELATCCQETQGNWDRMLPLMLMAYRSAEHEVTQYTPARLMLGREIRLPVDLGTGRPPDKELPTDTTEYAVDLQERFNRGAPQSAESPEAHGGGHEEAIRQKPERTSIQGRHASLALQSSATQRNVAEAAEPVGGPVYSTGLCI